MPYLAQMANRIREAWRALTGAPQTQRAIAPREAQSLATVELKERLLELELALDNIGWKRELAYSELEFSRQGLNGIIKISRLYALKNPVVKRGVELPAYYVFGRGFDVKSDDDDANQVIDDFLQLNQKELGHLGLVEKEKQLSTDGNLFFVEIPQPDGSLLIRTIDAVEMMDKITDPDDIDTPWFYQRIWTAKRFNIQTGQVEAKNERCWYPARGFDPPSKPATMGEWPVMWDTPVLHVKVGGYTKWLWGCPRTYATLDWARAYKEFLENWLTRLKAMTRIGYDIEIKGGQQAIDTVVNAFATTVATGDDNLRDFVDRNPPSTTAATYVHGPGQKLTVPNIAHSQGNPEEGRRALLMAAMSDGLPETMYGDVGRGNHATAKTMDRPTELMMLERQELWRETLQLLVTDAIRHNAGIGGSKIREAFNRSDRDVKNLVVKMVPRKLNKRGEWVEMWESVAAKRANGSNNGDINISVKFPAVLEHDIKEMLEAMVMVATLGNTQGEWAGTIDPKTWLIMALSEFPAVEDPQAVADAIYPSGSYDPTLWANDPTAVPPPPPAGGFPPKVTEALSLLTKRLTESLARSA
jgi:hypothetical protein